MPWGHWLFWTVEVAEARVQVTTPSTSLDSVCATAVDGLGEAVSPPVGVRLPRSAGWQNAAMTWISTDGAHLAGRAKADGDRWLHPCRPHAVGGGSPPTCVPSLPGTHSQFTGVEPGQG